MPSRPVTLMFRLSVSVFVIAALFSVALTATEQDPAKIAVAPTNWVINHRASLPKTINEIAAFPLAYRTAILAALPDQDRFRLIRQHIDDLLATRKDLSPEQRNYVLDVRKQISAFIDSGAQQASGENRAACELERSLFPNRMIRDIGVASFGEYSARQDSFQSSAVWAKELIRRAGARLVAHARGDSKLCNCSGDGFCDCNNYPFGCQSQACTVPQDGQGHDALICDRAGICGCGFCGTPVACTKYCVPVE